MSDQPLCELTMERQFNLRSFETQVDHMSRAQAQQVLVRMYQQMMLQEALYKRMIKRKWGIGPSPQL